jgi:TRAP-type C4-dicarboxylate transport system permease small subunit
MVSDDKQYEFVSSQVQVYNQRIADAFKLFIQLFSAIVGGSVWLSIQSHINTKSVRFERLSDILVILVAVFCTISILENLRAWRGYREAQSRLGGTDEAGQPRIPGPKDFRNSKEEGTMMATMFLSAGLFCYFNPFAP